MFRYKNTSKQLKCAPVFPNQRVYISTKLVEPKLRCELWNSALHPFFQSSLVGSGKEKICNGMISVCKVNQLTIGHASFTAQEEQSSKYSFGIGDLDGFLVQVFMTGSLAGEYAGNTVSVQAGDIIIREIGRPARSQVTDGSALIAILPRRLLCHKLVVNQLHGTVLQADAPETRLLSNFLFSLNNKAELFSPASTLKIEDAFIDLLYASLSTLGSDLLSKSNDSMSLRILRDRILSFIGSNFDDPELGIEMLTERFHVSRAHLYRAFKHDGGVANAIRDFRLDAAYKALLDPKFQGRSIEEIAFDCGFSSAKHFGRSFRTRFGIPPNKARVNGGMKPLLTNNAYEHFRQVAEQYALI